MQKMFKQKSTCSTKKICQTGVRRTLLSTSQQIDVHVIVKSIKFLNENMWQRNISKSRERRKFSDNRKWTLK